MNEKLERERRAMAPQDVDPLEAALSDDSGEDFKEDRSEWLTHAETRRKLVIMVKQRNQIIKELCTAATQSTDPKLLAMAERLKFTESMILIFGGTNLVINMAPTKKAPR